ncbi:hypothetical protein F5Y18DRAFT_367538 [Xylariaceae sp. FL1019]|nr:hypothetical protein F5Y18DRAFT_367538 [Xylariaceae sp. FL1019]
MSPAQPLSDTGSGTTALYTIYSSSTLKNSSTTARVLKAGDDIDNFVTALSDHALVLTKAPTDTDQTQVDDSDGTVKWLRQLDKSAVFAVTTDNAHGNDITSFAFTFKDPWLMTFSSKADILASTFDSVDPNAPWARIPTPGLQNLGMYLTCGLDCSTTKSISTKVSDLFSYAGIPDSESYLPRAIPGLAITLDTDPKVAKGKRNALWFRPGYSNEVHIRLQFALEDGGIKAFQDLIKGPLGGLGVQSKDGIQIICKKRVVQARTSTDLVAVSQSSVAFNMQCELKTSTTPSEVISLDTGVVFSDGVIDMTFVIRSPDGLSIMLKWLGSLVDHIFGDDDDHPIEGFVNSILGKKTGDDEFLSSIQFRRLRVILDTRQDKDKPTLSSFSLDIEAQGHFGYERGVTGSSPPVFLLTYTWNRRQGGAGSIRGHLWNEWTTFVDCDLLPTEENWTWLCPVSHDPGQTIDLAWLKPGTGSVEKVVNIPDTVPRIVTRAYVELSMDGINIGGTITAVGPSPTSVPQPYLGEISLNATFNWADKTFGVSLGIAALLQPSSTALLTHATPAQLRGNIAYDSPNKKWLLSASLEGLYASVLADFFDSKHTERVMPLINSLVIDQLRVEYRYEKSAQGDPTAPNNAAIKERSAASFFQVDGKIRIASWAARLAFIHDAIIGWTFDITLDPKDKNPDTTLGDAIRDIIGKDEIDLPDFIDHVRLDPAKQTDPNRPALHISVTKVFTQKTALIPASESFQLIAQIYAGDVSLQFTQLFNTAWEAGSAPKRVFKAALSLPDMQMTGIPLIGDFTQPFDELYYLWVSDPPPRAGTPAASKSKTRFAGLTRSDVAQLQAVLEEGTYKDKFRDQSNLEDPILAQGSHFAVVVTDLEGKRSCLLNYEFSTPKQKGSGTTNNRSPVLGSLVDEEDPDGDQISKEKTSTAHAPLKRESGPLVISNIGFQYKQKTLFISFDAMFVLGPLAFSLIGFSIGAKFDTLDTLPSLSCSIEGLAAVFDKPPLTIAGLIRHGNDGHGDYYAGGMIIGFVPYQFQAAGFYGTTIPEGASLKDAYTSVFIFAKLDGPLVELEFGEISGVTGGFGYNSEVRLPTAAQVTDFPFVATGALDKADSALKKLEMLTSPKGDGWFHPLDNTYWAAAGMKVDAFQMLTIDAVVLLQLGTSVKLAVFAVAVADLPTAKSEFKFAHVELGLGVIVDLDYGVLKVEAQLSPRSFILHPDCHLTGGCALWYWFEAPHADRSNVGNFVFTLGGYHEAFQVPAGWPNPPRLGISWSLGSQLKIVGEAYFAITPKVCMGGGRIRASFSAGPLEAWFDAFFNFLINYMPFHFGAEAQISVGVRYNLDAGFIHTHVSAEISAGLYLWGPPLAGRVHVDFWVTSFDIDFGDSPTSYAAVRLYEFYLLVLQASQKNLDAAARKREVAEEKKRPLNEGHVFLVEQGLLNPSDATERKSNAPWTVRGGTLSFTVACKMAIHAFRTGNDMPDTLTHGSSPGESDVHAKPMCLVDPLKSTLVVVYSQNDKPKPTTQWRFEKIIKEVPQGLWSKYEKTRDPLAKNVKMDNTLYEGGGGTIPLMMGIRYLAPKAHMSPDPYPKYNEANRELETIAIDRPFPFSKDRANASLAWAPAFTGEETVGDRYEKVHAAWATPALSVAGEKQSPQARFVDTWINVFGWDKSDSVWSKPGMPEKLGKRFEDVYVVAPQTTRPV